MLWKLLYGCLWTSLILTGLPYPRSLFLLPSSSFSSSCSSLSSSFLQYIFQSNIQDAYNVTQPFEICIVYVISCIYDDISQIFLPLYNSSVYVLCALSYGLIVRSALKCRVLECWVHRKYIYGCEKIKLVKWMLRDQQHTAQNRKEKLECQRVNDVTRARASARKKKETEEQKKCIL